MSFLNALGLAAAAPPRREIGLRLSCRPCAVLWTGPVASRCWVCDGPGIPGPAVPMWWPELEEYV